MATQPDVSQIIAGPGLIFVAPVGTAPPSLASLPVTFNNPWYQVGYTEDGIDFTYSVTLKEEYVDEEAAIVLDILEKEGATVQAKMAESNITNLALAISASATTGAAISVGSLPLSYYAIAITGPAPNGNLRVISFSKAISKASTSLRFTRKGKQIIPVTWDARKLAGQNLFTITDVGTGYENS
jgi:hypothetical protein